MRLTGGNFWGSPPPAGNFASMSTSAPGLSMANWPSAGPDWTSKTSSASLSERPLVDVDGTQRRAVTALVDPGGLRLFEPPPLRPSGEWRGEQRDRPTNERCRVSSGGPNG